MRTRFRLSWPWSQTLTLTIQVACLVAVILFDPHDLWAVGGISATIGANIGSGTYFSRRGRRLQRPHLFDPDQWSRTSAVVGIDPVLPWIMGGDGEISGRSMATCAVCGMGENWRAHQSWRWRFRHPVALQRHLAPEGLARWTGWQSPLPPVWLWHAVFDGTRLCRCVHSHEYRDLACRNDR